MKVDLLAYCSFVDVQLPLSLDDSQNSRLPVKAIDKIGQIIQHTQVVLHHDDIAARAVNIGNMNKTTLFYKCRRVNESRKGDNFTLMCFKTCEQSLKPEQ